MASQCLFLILGNKSLWQYLYGTTLKKIRHNPHVNVTRAREKESHRGRDKANLKACISELSLLHKERHTLLSLAGNLRESACCSCSCQFTGAELCLSSRSCLCPHGLIVFKVCHRSCYPPLLGAGSSGVSTWPCRKPEAPWDGLG